MRAIIQRVSSSRVIVDGVTIGEIGVGLLVLLGVTHADTDAEARKLGEKIAVLRIFADDDDKMNRDVSEAGGGVLVVSQFTLHGDCRKGRRPSFVAAARPEQAEPLYEAFVMYLRGVGIKTATGKFGAMMKVELVNDGPVTLILDTEELR